VVLMASGGLLNSSSEEFVQSAGETVGVLGRFLIGMMDQFDPMS
jgi:hypothetical protein